MRLIIVAQVIVLRIHVELRRHCLLLQFKSNVVEIYVFQYVCCISRFDGVVHCFLLMLASDFDGTVLSILWFQLDTRLSLLRHDCV